MGVTKTQNFSQHQNQIANLLKALAHPARVAIIEYLLKVNRCICGDIVEELPLAQATISQHLKELKNAGIIRGTVEGTSICYCLDANTIEILKIYFHNLHNSLTKSCCSTL